MDNFLLNPNVAYLLLIGGFVLGFMAFITPGTGLIEIGALLILLLAGYEIYNLPINWVAFIPLALGVGLFLLALRRSANRWWLVGALLAFVLGSAFLFRDANNVWLPAVNPLLALVASASAGGYLWITVTKSLEAMRQRPSQDLQTLIGQVGEAKTDVYGDGTVQVDGELWSAQSDEPIPAGDMVKVVAREGFILKVTPQ